MAARGVVVVRFMFSDDQLKAIRHHHGGRGKADREQVRRWIEMLVMSTAQDLLWEYDNRERLLGRGEES